MENIKALVSVIIPIYNSAPFLDECLESVICQTFQGNIEVSIYNDKSTDDSPYIISQWVQKFNQKTNFSVVVGTNDGSEGKGCGFAKNKAISQSSGLYLCFLDSDDVMMPERISIQYKVALDYPKAIIGSNIERIPTDATARYTNWCNSLTPLQLYSQQFREVTVIQPTWFFERSIYDKVGGYEPTQGLPEDMIFFHKHLSLGGELFKVPQPLIKYRYHVNMTSSSIPRNTLVKYRVVHFEKTILIKPEWTKFMIWGCGRDGKNLYKTLSPENQAKVIAFCDVNTRLIGTQIVLNHVTRHKIPVLHWTEIKPPFVTCVALDRYPEFEENLASFNFTEGVHYYHLI